VKGADEKPFFTEQRKCKGKIAEPCPVSERHAFPKRKIVLSDWKRRI